MTVRLKPLESEDLRFVHELTNNEAIMRYWFEEPYEAFYELQELYNKHIHATSERRFIIDDDGEKAGLIELIEIDHIHSKAELQIIVDPRKQGNGIAKKAVKLAMDYAFKILNIYKLYLVVDVENEKAVHIYLSLGFEKEGILKHEFFADGKYRNALRMSTFQDQYLGNI